MKTKNRTQDMQYIAIANRARHGSSGWWDWKIEKAGLGENGRWQIVLLEKNPHDQLTVTTAKDRSEGWLGAKLLHGNQQLSYMLKILEHVVKQNPN